MAFMMEEFETKPCPDAEPLKTWQCTLKRDQHSGRQLTQVEVDEMFGFMGHK